MPRVLIIDDEPGIRFALKRWFERHQWAVAEADNGETAMTHVLASDEAGKTRIDLIICDWHLPTLSGEGLLRALQSSRPEIVDRLILSTGDAVCDAPLDSALSSHPYVLQKPFDLATLGTLVATIVR